MASQAGRVRKTRTDWIDLENLSTSSGLLLYDVTSGGLRFCMTSLRVDNIWMTQRPAIYSMAAGVSVVTEVRSDSPKRVKSGCF